jgi:hypothetical protein
MGHRADLETLAALAKVRRAAGLPHTVRQRRALRKVERLEARRNAFDDQPWVRELQQMAKGKSGNGTAGSTGRGNGTTQQGEHPTPAPKVDASRLSPTDFAALLAARGLSLPGYEARTCNAPRPAPAPEVVQAQEAAAARVENRRAERLASLGTFDARTATPEQVEARLAAMGISRDASTPRDQMFARRPPPECGFRPT